MMSGALVVFFFFLSSGSFFGAAVFNRRFEEILPITSCSIVLVLFLFGLFGWLIPGIYFVCFVLFAIILYSIIYITRERENSPFLSAFFTPGFFVFLFLYIVLIILHYDRQPFQWDEFSHWASVVKCMVQTDSFVTNPATSQMTFRSYVPGMALFQYFLQKIISALDPSISFCEWALFFAYHIFTASFLLPFLKKVRFQVFISTAIVFFFVFLSPVIAFPELYLLTIYIDSFVGIVAGAGAAFLYLNKNIDVVTVLFILLTIAILVLSKDVGLLFAVFLAGIFLFQIFLLKGTEKKQGLRRAILLSLYTISAIVLPKGCWNLHLNAWHISKSFASPTDYNVLWSVLNGTDQTYRTSVLQNYKEVLFHTGPGFVWFGIGFTYPMLLAVFIVVLIAITTATLSANSKKERISKGVVISVVFLEACFYAFGLLVIYLFRFSKSQAMNLVSVYRYLNIPVLAIQTMILLILFASLPHAISWRRTVTITLMVILFLPAFPKENVKAFLTRSSIQESAENRGVLDDYSETILSKLQNSPCRIYIISQGSNGYIYWALRYTLKPNTVNEGAWSISPDGAPLFDGDSYTKKKEPEKLRDELDSYDYVVLCKITEKFKKDYAELFDGRYFIRLGLYKVNHESRLLEPAQ